MWNYAEGLQTTAADEEGWVFSGSEPPPPWSASVIEDMEYECGVPYPCFNDGKTMDHLMKVTEGWNAWMDENDRHDYFAAMLVPQFRSPDIDFDIGWAGLWEDGATMAASNQFWVENGGDQQKAFWEVVTCKQHAAFAMMTIKRSASAGQSGPVQFSNCSIREGGTFDDVMGAGRQQMLTTLAVRAFFESHFASDAAERAEHARFLRETLPQELADVEYEEARRS